MLESFFGGVVIDALPALAIGALASRPPTVSSKAAASGTHHPRFS